MSLWSRISDALAALASGEGLGAMFDKLRKPPELTVGFAIAVIALGAKMAKADGLVTRNEVTAFREVFAIPQADERSAARVFNLAREDVAGFEDYARKIATMFEADSAVLMDLLDGLFHIAVADGEYHPAEDAFLERVAEIFGMSKRDFAALRARNVPDADPDPYTVLGVDPAMSLAEIRKVWRRLVVETHPDRMMARGVPEEAVQLAQTRLIAINRAWEEIEAHHGS
jgi:DnaJ like chaperone protein